ncbi:MAG TPA: hypothetical protein VF407_06695, partial [Polyangiaceae bacterium]
LALALICACKGGSSSDAPTASASPQASAVPAPLATLQPTSSGTAAPNGDAGPPPVPMRGDQPAPPDALALPGKEFAGYTLQAVVRSDAPPSPRGPEANAAAIDLARKKNEAHLTIDLAVSHARVTFGRGFAVAEGAELRERADRYGYILLLDQQSYRVVSPGALRALFAERRIDVAPLAQADVKIGEDGARRLGVGTRKVDLTTRAAKATFEIARVADAGDSGALLCRVLLDWIGAAPSTPLCGVDEVPLHAELRWATKGSFTFDATSIVRRLDLMPADLVMPPPTTYFVAGPLPPQGGDVLLSPTELAAIHNGPPDQKASLRLFNSSDQLRFVLADGAPIAWVAPGARIEVPGLSSGRYSIEWRTFFGDADVPPVATPVPGSSESGVLDAGAP